MKKLLFISVMLLFITAIATATVSVDMYASPAPNVYGATSFDTWWSNAQYAVSNGLSNYGTGNGTYEAISGTNGESDIRPAYEAVVSGFDSWHGVAGGTGENGTRMHFVYHIQASAGEALSLSNISGIEVFEDGWGDIDYPIYETFYGSAVSFDASTILDPDKRVGYAANGTAVTTGTVEEWDAANPTNTISDIIGNFGMAYAVYFPNNIYYGGTTEQEELDLGIADMHNNLDNWNATLTYDTTTVTTQANFVPEPATMVLMGLGALLLRRKK